jgi:two-component system, OmpR family, alkaline phosphatase synthesis response regulator PhoP
MDQNRVLIVEDDREIAQVIAVNVEDLGLKTIHVTNGKEGLNKALSGKYSLIILDIMLPGLDGISVCRNIRDKDIQTPILMVTARAEEIDRVLGLELGADDYMTKPFSVRELTARVKALLRRSQITQNNSGREKEDSEISIGNLTMDFNKRKVLLNREEIQVTVKEFDLLALFIKNQGRAYSRGELLNLIWGYEFQGYEHTVNTHINRLRNKIEKDAADPEYLKTVWGVGYRFAEEKEFIHD